VLISTRLADRTGADVVRELRDRYDNLDRVPMIIVTGASDAQSMRSASESGADAYIVRPVDLDALTRALNEIGNYKLQILDMRGQGDVSAVD
jgi:response regulator RpfG family c-di-GMP phosphodiesterase